MEAIILCGIQATGKSTFCKGRLFSSHVRVNLDMLKTRHREEVLLRACIDAKQAFVVDNTNPTRAERARYIAMAKAASFRVTGFFFESRISDALSRNGARPTEEQIPDVGIKGTSARLELPDPAEGFDQLFHVRIVDGGFEVQEWKHEV